MTGDHAAEVERVYRSDQAHAGTHEYEVAGVVPRVAGPVKVSTPLNRALHQTGEQ